MPQWMSDVPVFVWLVAVALLAMAGQYVRLYVRYRRHRPASVAAERRLTGAATALRAYADRHLQRLPDRLDEVSAEDLSGVAYRWVPRLTLDGRLIVLHDAGPTHKLLQLPNLRDGRGVVLCNGRLLVISEEAFDKLLHADDALRARLGLSPAADTVATDGDANADAAPGGDNG